MEKVNINPIVKTGCIVYGTVCGVCGAILADTIIENIVPKPASLVLKVVYGIGGYSIGVMVGDKITTYFDDYVENKAEELSDCVNDIKKIIKKNQIEEA